jgi:hypothetical protein
MSLGVAGPLLIAMVGLAAISTLFGVVVVTIPTSLRMPWAGLIFVLVMATWAAYQSTDIDSENPLLRTAATRALEAQRNDAACKRTPHSSLVSLREHTKDVHPQSRKGRDQDGNEDIADRTIYLVSAEGGGIRAAYWTALHLAQLDIATEGRFAEEAAVLSGVSGGSLGIATWLATRDRTDLDARGRLELAARFLGSDFLSPLLGGFLFLDIPRLLLGPAWPSAGRDHVFEKALVDKWASIGETDFFARPVVSLCLRGFQRVPAVYFNATDAQTGSHVPLSRSILISNRFTTYAGPVELGATTLANATVAQIVHVSARFPYLSPATQIGINATVQVAQFRRRQFFPLNQPETEEDARAAEEEIKVGLRKARDEGLWSRLWVLVDGGYLDNTGLLPISDAMAHITQERLREASTMLSGENAPYTRTRVQAIHISGDPGVPCIRLLDGWRPSEKNGLGPAARKYLDATQSKPRCQHELTSLMESFAANPLQWFTTPIESLVQVRSEHSRRAVRQFGLNHRRDIPGRAYLYEFGLNEALDQAYGETGIPAGVSPPRMPSPRSPFASHFAPRLKAIVDQAVREGVMTQVAADNYLNDLYIWRDGILSEPQRAQCSEKNLLLGPPLGWTLSKSNQDLMKCLLLRSAARHGVAAPPIPLPPHVRRIFVQGGRNLWGGFYEEPGTVAVPMPPPSASQPGGIAR